jgi:glycosyltransferase involved in cell wall biosynthesis
MLRIAFVVEGIPEPGSSGGAMAMWSLIEAALQRGFEVSAVLLVASWDQSRGPAELNRRCDALVELGVSVRMYSLPEPVRKSRKLPALRLTSPDLYQHIRLRGELQAALAELEPDVVVGFDTGTLMLLRESALGIPVLAIPGDPLYLVWRYRLALTRGRERLRARFLVDVIRYAVSARALRRNLLDVVAAADAAAVFGSQHTAWFRKNGVDCFEFPVPVVDRSGGALRRCELDDPPSILLLGSLSGTATRHGLRILPAVMRELDESLGRGAFQVRVTGSGELPDRTLRDLSRMGVVFRGFVEDSAAEIAAADVFFYPSPYPVGARTRIVEALSTGAAIVAHRSAAAGLEALEHGRNALLADDPADLARQITRILADDDLRVRLRNEARATYERLFLPERASARVLDEVERLADGVFSP